MKCTLVNLFLLYSAMIARRGHYVQGVGYQPSDQSSKGGDHSDNLSAANYKFEYAVNDETVGQQFGHEEERNGHQTRGRYSVLLPDGRLQVVTYTADQAGYKADVRYENGPTAIPRSGSGGGGGGNGYENVEAAATSYGSTPPATKTIKSSGYSSSGDGSFGRRRTKSRNFVTVRKTVNGRMFNYKY